MISGGRDAVRGRPSASKPSKDYIVTRLRELQDVNIDLGDYETAKLLQIYISSYTSNYVQGLILAIARHKENNEVGLLVNLALRYNLANNDIKVSVKNAIRVYEPLISNLINLTKDLEPVFTFK